jgi:transposase-like protein
MSKRKNRKAGTPNLPKETLERARQEAGLIPAPEPTEAVEVEEVVETVVAEAPEVRRLRDTLPPAQASKRKSRRKQQLSYEEMTPEEVADALANPTIVVTEESLREQYSYVLADLRSMAILAGLLFVALIVIAGVVVA